MLERSNTTIPGIPPTDAISTSCTIPFLLCDLRPGDRDKLGNTVHEILWIGSNYAIYRSDKGVYAHFSDCPAEAQLNSPIHRHLSRAMRTQLSHKPNGVRIFAFHFCHVAEKG